MTGGSIVCPFTRTLTDTSVHAHTHAHRDSKLTRFLQPALEGNALIAIICSISASVACLDETHNTLKVRPPVLFAI